MLFKIRITRIIVCLSFLVACAPLSLVWAESSYKTDPIWEQIGPALQNQEFDKAVEFLKKAIEKSPNEGGYHVILAQTYLALKNDEKAKEHFDKAVNLNVDNEMAYVGRSFYAEDFSEKERWLKTAIEKFPNRCIAALSLLQGEYISKTVEEQARGNIDGALDYLRKAKKIIQDFIEAVENTPEDFFLAQWEKDYAGAGPDQSAEIKERFSKENLINNSRKSIGHISEYEEVLLKIKADR